MPGVEVTQLRVDAFGVVVPIEVHGPDLAEAVADAWRDALTEAEPSVPAISAAVGLDAPTQVRGADVDEVLHYLSPTVTTHAIGARIGELVMLHAAALADPSTGDTAVLVAASGTGKTTASRTLAQRLVYLSDETAAIGRDGRVLPYRKPLSIIESAGSPLKRQVAASAMGLNTEQGEFRIKALLVIERSPNHPARPTVTTLDVVDAIAAIAPQTSYLPSFERPLHRLAEVIRHAGGAHRVTYREAATLEPVIADLLGGRA